MKTRAFFILISLSLLTSCTTTPEEKPRQTYLPKSEVTYFKKDRQKKTYNRIDVPELMEELEMNSPPENVGYVEKSFNTCEVDANKSDHPSCQKLYLSRLNYQVVCRDSTGTVEKVNLTPMDSQKMRWRSPGKRGYTKTDKNGYGQVGFISRRPASQSYLYLHLGSKIARKRFKDNWKLVLPKSWCLDH